MIRTVSNWLKEPSIIMNAPAGSDVKVILYVYADAVTTCDCGKELVLTQRAFGNPTYTGACKCGKSWCLRSGKIWSVQAAADKTQPN